MTCLWRCTWPRGKASNLLRALPPSYCLHSLVGSWCNCLLALFFSSSSPLQWVQLEASVLLPTPCQARFALSNSCSGETSRSVDDRESNSQTWLQWRKMGRGKTAAGFLIFVIFPWNFDNKCKMWFRYHPVVILNIKWHHFLFSAPVDCPEQCCDETIWGSRTKGLFCEV